MASGKKNYFRHSFFASEDPKLQRVIETMGFEGYGYYFSLIELCGRQCTDEMKNPVLFHVNTIRKVWRKNTESTKKVLRKLEESGLFLVTFSEHSVSIDIPSLGKYLGRYDSNMPNKRKEKEIKEKETTSPSALSEIVPVPKKNLPKAQTQETPKTILFEAEAPSLEIVSEISQDASNALTLLNTLCFKSFMPVKGNMKHINARLKEGYKLEDFRKVIQFKQEQWGNDPKMRAYLRPETIFGGKFDSYLAEASDERLKTISDDELIRQFFPGFTA